MNKLLRQSNDEILAFLQASGRLFYGADGAMDDTVTGQTSFATTTPTLQLDVPDGTTAIPLQFWLRQTGTVAGGPITILAEFDNADRYASGGTSETVLCSRTSGGFTNNATLRSGPTASDAYGIRVFADTQIAETSETIEETVQPPPVVWSPTAGLDMLVGPAAWNIYSYASTTGPTWFWFVKWAEVPTDWLN